MFVPFLLANCLILKLKINFPPSNKNSLMSDKDSQFLETHVKGFIKSNH